MRVYLDTNILLDIIEQRMPHYPVSLAVLERCDDLNFELFVAWHGLATVFYITARKQSEADATNMIRNLLNWATVSTVGHDQAQQALGYGITDYEDALQAAAANACAASWIVTRDSTGFTGSPVPVISPDDFVLRFTASAGTQ